MMCTVVRSKHSPAPRRSNWNANGRDIDAASARLERTACRILSCAGHDAELRAPGEELLADAVHHEAFMAPMDMKKRDVAVALSVALESMVDAAMRRR